MSGIVHAWIRKLVPRQARRSISRWRQWPPVGRVHMGDLRRFEPISRDFGDRRGTPVDRHYIERFLQQNETLVRGRVMEIGTDMYTRRFGRGRVTRSDVLHVADRNPGVTIVADLARDNDVPSDAFDCIIFTQTLMFIYDVRAVAKSLHRILAPGGVALVTATGISPISRVDMDRWGHYWSFTTASMRRLLEDEFGRANVVVEDKGNVLSATAFLHGMCLEELTVAELDHHDPDYPVVITAVARKGS